MNSNSIYDLTRADLSTICETAGYQTYKVRQLLSWLYKKKETSLAQMSDLGKNYSAFLQGQFSFSQLKIVKQQVSADKTIKFLLACEDGQMVETVVMRHSYGNSVCVSSQVGCLMGCRFCASGLLKKVRNLTVGEMVLQVLQAEVEIQQRIDNVVVMGSGEPFDNFENVLKFLAIINDDWSLAIGARHITVSTCGLVPQIIDFATQPAYNLAISFHGATNDLRDYLMPINKKYDLNCLKKALLEYQKLKNRRISLEYILLNGVNDKERDIVAIKEFIKGIDNVYLNLIPYNSVVECGFKGVSEVAALKFYNLLKKANIAVTLRNKRGEDIDAACGQLRNRVAQGDC